MATSQWMDDSILGLEPFDKEHMGLFRLIDDLNEALKAKMGDVVIDSILADLENYTITHFGHEEEFFERIDYPKRGEHIAEHLKFANDIARFRLEFFENKIGVPVKVVSYLRDWLMNHIKIKDMDYGRFAKEQGCV
jgi:hemerythrin